MQFRGNHVLNFVFLGVLLAVLSNYVRAEEKQWVVFYDDLSPEVRRISIPLTFNPSESTFYECSMQQVHSEEIQGAGKKEGYKQQFNFGTAVDGNQYTMQIREATDFKIISRDSDSLCEVKIFRTTGKNKPVIIKEGYIFFDREVEIPLEVSAIQLSIPTKEPVSGNATINIYNNDRPTYQGRFNVHIQGALSGSTTVENALINASITCRNSVDMKDRQLNLSIKPFNDQKAPAAVNGKISDILAVGSAKLVVEKIASDSSEMTLALLSGDLIQEKKPGAMVVKEGKLFPEFVRVELVNRRLLTLSDLKKQVGADGYVVLIFGEFKRTMPAMPGMPMHDPRFQVRSLTLDEVTMVDTLKNGCEKSVVIGFVCQQLSPADMYEKWLGQDLNFYVLSDFSNPVDMQFGSVGMERFGYRRPDSVETLRKQLGLPNDTIITILISGHGELISINTDAGKELSGSLVQINQLMKENKKAEDSSSAN
jgi:hypothetical protein